MANFWTASSELIRPCWWGSHVGTAYSRSGRMQDRYKCSMVGGVAYW